MKAAHLLQPTPGSLAISDSSTLSRNALVTGIGFAIYGFTIGVWRSPWMGLFVAAKMPLLIALTLGFNSLLNGLFGMLLGARLGLAGSLNALLSAFAISALILGSLGPVALFLAASMPSPTSASANTAHSAQVLAHTLLIAIAGLAGVLRLGRLLDEHAISRTAARATLAAWIIGNAFLGSQFAWILRPFFGSPNLEVAFLRPNPMRGSFYETIWSMATSVIGNPQDLIAPACLVLLPLLFWWMLRNDSNQQPTTTQ
ncbi:MAG: hypothetical protein ACNA8L_12990 [Luteolibacter sp.]|jgi:hypothetical protein